MSDVEVVVFDYGAGNMHSLVKAIEGDGVTVRLETDPARACDGDALVLPGVGAFTPAAAMLAPARDRMRDAILDGLPTLGICLGMQSLFDISEEGPGDGLGVIAGRVRRLRARRVPQIGWNAVDSMDDGIPEMAYFANSFVCEPDDEDAIVGWSTHESDRFASVVAMGSVIGVQFHPEKSSGAGVQFVRNFVAGCAR